MRFSGFSFRLGKRTRLYFSNPKTPASKTTAASAAPVQQGDPEPRTTFGGIIWRFIVLYIACNWVVKAYWLGDLLPFIITVIIAAGAVALFLGYFFSIHRAHDAWENARRAPAAPPQTTQAVAEPETTVKAAPAEAWQEELDDMEKAEKLQAQLDAEATARTPKYKTVPILLELDMSPEHQQALKDLKLKIATRGLRGDLVLQQDDNVISVLVNEFVLGKVSTADALWIDRCFTYIDTLKGFEIVGGGRDMHGTAIPFMVVVDLSIHSTAPGVPDKRSFDLPSAERIWGAKPDLVCYVSRTGMAHHKMGNCNIGADWTPMFVFDAAEQGFKPCSKCFH